MQIGRDDDSEPRTRLDVDMRIDTALAYEPQPGKAFEQRRRNFCPFTNQDYRLGVSQPVGE
jgi:hypothetical protein